MTSSQGSRGSANPPPPPFLQPPHPLPCPCRLLAFLNLAGKGVGNTGSNDAAMSDADDCRGELGFVDYTDYFAEVDTCGVCGACDMCHLAGEVSMAFTAWMASISAGKMLEWQGFMDRAIDVMGEP